jgi:V/A-type H+/Na+-transporting ATPase subunit F
MDIAVIGSDEFTLGFRLAGVKRVFIADQTNYQEKMQEAISDANVGVLAVNADDLQYLPANFKTKVLDLIQPVVVPVGGDQSDLREKVKKVIGVDLFKTEDE